MVREENAQLGNGLTWLERLRQKKRGQWKIVEEVGGDISPLRESTAFPSDTIEIWMLSLRVKYRSLRIDNVIRFTRAYVTRVSEAKVDFLVVFTVFDVLFL
jgi:hypothetical protein